MLFPGKILLLSPHRLFLYSMLKDGCFSWYFSAQSLKMNQPEFLTPLRNHTVEVGKNVTFECYVTGIEKYKVSIFLLSFKISHASRLSLHKRGEQSLKKDSMTPPFPSKRGSFPWCFWVGMLKNDLIFKNALRVELMGENKR